MKKNFILLTLLLAFGPLLQKAHAQTYQAFPTSDASWNVARCWVFFPAGWHDSYRFSMEGNDTLYMGNTYSQIFIQRHEKHGPNFDSIYPKQFFGGIRETNKEIYIFQALGTVDTTEHLIYDFNYTNIGDTIFTASLAGSAKDLIPHLVIHVDSVLVGGVYHKRLHLQDPNNSFNSEFWIEGVGSSWGLPYASFWSITDNSYDLTCFYRLNDLKYGNQSPTFGFCIAPLPETNCGCINGGQESLSICEGDSVLIAGMFRSKAGTYFDTLTSSTGCDSVVTTNLSILDNSTGVLNASACPKVGFTVSSGKATYYSSGTYFDTLANAHSCDSVITIQLTVDTINTNITANAATLTSDLGGVIYQWLDCENNYQPITGEKAQSFTATANGSYAVKITQNGCTDTSVCQNVALSGMVELDAMATLLIHPNPTNGKFRIGMKHLPGTATIEIFNPLMQKVTTIPLNASATEVDLSGYTEGIYYIRLQTEKGVITQPLVLYHTK